MTERLDGGDAILEALRNLDIDYIISSPGSEWPSVWEALARQKVNEQPGPTYINCWHETLAVAMASGYTRMTGRMQAVLLHAGVGVLQGSMGIHGAYQSEVPMLVCSGESTTYGEVAEVDPGPQWLRNLSIVGRPQSAGGALYQVEQPGYQRLNAVRDGGPGRRAGPEGTQGSGIPERAHRDDAGGMESETAAEASPRRAGRTP